MEIGDIIALAHAGFSVQQIEAAAKLQTQQQTTPATGADSLLGSGLGTGAGAGAGAGAGTGVNPFEQMLLQQQQMLNLLAKNNVYAAQQPTGAAAQVIDPLASLINPVEGGSPDKILNVFGGEIK